MKLFKYCCAILAVAYLISAALPYTQPSGAPQLTPVWVGRAMLAMDALFLGIMFFGVQSRKLIFWKLIPILMMVWLLSNMIGPLLYSIWFSKPLLPFVIIIVIFPIGLSAFVVWWRSQKNYFEADARR